MVNHQLRARCGFGNRAASRTVCTADIDHKSIRMFATPAFAQAASGASASGGTASTLFFLGQFVLIGLIFYS